MADSESKTPFTEAGECLDEIIFEFDDGQILYVSQSFLHYVSPVFKAMFQNEKETRIVKLKGKQYGDFLKCLLCLHPGEQKPVDGKNVFRVVQFAEEYQTKSLIKKSIITMSELLKSELKAARGPDVLERIRRVSTCLKILTTAIVFQYDETATEACETIGHFGHALFTGTLPVPKPYSTRYDKDSEKRIALADCKKLYEGLPEALKMNLLLERLRHRDNNEIPN